MNSKTVIWMLPAFFLGMSVNNCVNLKTLRMKGNPQMDECRAECREGELVAVDPGGLCICMSVRKTIQL